MSIFSKRLTTRESYLQLPWKEWSYFKNHYFLIEKQAILAEIENLFRKLPQLYRFKIEKKDKHEFKNSGKYRISKKKGITLINDEVSINVYDHNGFLLKDRDLEYVLSSLCNYGFRKLNFLSAYLPRLTRHNRFEVYRKISLFWPRYNQVIVQWEMRIEKEFDTVQMVKFDNVLLPLYVLNKSHWEYLNHSFSFIDFYDRIFESEIIEKQKVIWDIEFLFRKYNDLEEIILNDLLKQVRDNTLNFDIKRNILFKKEMNNFVIFEIENVFESMNPYIISKIMYNSIIKINRENRYAIYEKIVNHTQIIDKKFIKDIKTWKNR